MPVLFTRFSQVATHYRKKTALISEGESYSYGDLAQRVDHWAKRISALHDDQKPQVGLLCEQALHNATLSLSLAQINGICIPSNTHLTAEQLVTGWRLCEVTLVIYEPEFATTIEKCDAPDIRFISTDELWSQQNRSDHIWPDSDAFLIVLSSGSTGDPKPIVISQEVKLNRQQQAWDLYKLTADDVVLCASPFFHSMGLRLVYTPLLLGCTLVHMKSFTPTDWLNLVKRHGVTYTTSVSSHLYALKDKLLDNAAQVRSLKTIVTSSAPIDSHFKDQLFQQIGCDFHEIYGATEVACATNLFPRDAKEKFSSVGKNCPDVDIRLLDDELEEVQQSEVGEITVRSPLAFSCYYKRPDLTKASYAGDFFRTGDLGFMDEDGFLTYVGRKKDIIISGGINIYPKDIEAVLASCDGIRETAVIGVDDDLLGEVVVAVCISENNKKLERNLRKLANKELAPFQRPLKYFFVENFPLTASGKLSKRELRKEYNELNDGWTDVLRMMMYGTGE
ncbi:class I adenylate-forming enzyme family protein [Terasakiella sp. SH-1]|uniref:class I adenylate-forming enzyme family protein n=1 Tax=Terasakiella sp. SH-1 TaxID=2560057 RepID=UPI001074021C|nr:class I adenylate-forming enzyme family protein [Terasakiella sp. SH-1]